MKRETVETKEHEIYELRNFPENKDVPIYIDYEHETANVPLPDHNVIIYAYMTRCALAYDPEIPDPKLMCDRDDTLTYSIIFYGDENKNNNDKFIKQLVVGIHDHIDPILRGKFNVTDEVSKINVVAGLTDRIVP